MASLNLPTSICQFSAHLYDQINSLHANDRNLNVSPLSIHLALTLALMGAGGDTAAEIAKGLRLQAIDNTDIANAYQMLHSSLGLKLTIANKMFLMEGFMLKTTFNNIATTQFFSEIQEINFKDTNGTANIINTWIDKKTKHLIKNIVAKNTLSRDTKLVVVNAIHLKCKWSQMFGSCKKEPFFLSDTKSFMVDMMHQKNAFPYAEIEELDSKVVVLDYNKTNLSMVIVLPNVRTGLDALDQKLKTTPLSHIIQQTKSAIQMDLYLPKFSVELEVNLKEVLIKMGMTLMFKEKKANFENMLNKSKGAFIGNILHKTFIKVMSTGPRPQRVRFIILCYPLQHLFNICSLKPTTRFIILFVTRIM